jgi:hypothetical protein
MRYEKNISEQFQADTVLYELRVLCPKQEAKQRNGQ